MQGFLFFITEKRSRCVYHSADIETGFSLCKYTLLHIFDCRHSFFNNILTFKNFRILDWKSLCVFVVCKLLLKMCPVKRKFCMENGCAQSVACRVSFCWLIPKGTLPKPAATLWIWDPGQRTKTVLLFVLFWLQVIAVRALRHHFVFGCYEEILLEGIWTLRNSP